MDNLLEGLLDLGVKALRIGRPVKVREHLRSATLDAMLENHPMQEELAFLQDEQRELRKALPSLRGKEKGLMHRDININHKEIRRMEDAMTAVALRNAAVGASMRKGLNVTYDLSPWVLGYAHVSHVLRVLTKWEQASDIGGVVVSAFTLGIPREMQQSFIECMTKQRPTLSIRYRNDNTSGAATTTRTCPGGGRTKCHPWPPPPNQSFSLMTNSG